MKSLATMLLFNHVSYKLLYMDDLLQDGPNVIQIHKQNKSHTIILHLMSRLGYVQV